MNNTTELIDITEVVKILKVSMQTLRRWDKEGKLKSIRLSKRGNRKYSRESIEKFIENAQQK